MIETIKTKYLGNCFELTLEKKSGKYHLWLTDTLYKTNEYCGDFTSKAKAIAYFNIYQNIRGY